MTEPRLIPLYDATAPIACTISEADLPGRIATIERLRAGLTSVERTPTGLLLRFPDRQSTRRDLEAFVVDEKRCCQFWGFALVDERERIALHWDAPPAATDLVDQLHTFFTTDAPVSVLQGLL